MTLRLWYYYNDNIINILTAIENFILILYCSSFSLLFFVYSYFWYIFSYIFYFFSHLQHKTSISNKSSSCVVRGK